VMRGPAESDVALTDDANAQLLLRYRLAAAAAAASASSAVSVPSASHVTCHAVSSDGQRE
jgi:hypothetical protein